MTILCREMKMIDNQVVDIEIENGRISRIENHIPVTNQQVIEGDKTTYISSGWIDIHTHCFDKFELYGDQIDKVGYPHGVTTVVDAGTSGANTIDEFIEQTKKAKTNAYAFFNIASCGISQQDELSDLSRLEADKIKIAFTKYPNQLIGLKARMSASVLGQSGLAPLYFSLYMAEMMDVPIMVHIGSQPADLMDVMRLVRKGDILTHIFNPKVNGILDSSGKLKKFVRAAKDKGIYFDLGHGTESFSFDVCESARKQGICCDSISTDIYFRNRENGPVYNMATTLNKLLSCGYSLKEVIEAVTLHPAKMMRKPELGELKVGYCGDVTMFKMKDESITLIDSVGQKRIVEKIIYPLGVVLNQEYIRCEGES